MSIFKKFFNKEDSGKSPMEQILTAAKFMGFDIPKMVEDKIPEIVQQAKAAEQRAGYPLFIGIALDETQEHFVLSLFKVTSDGADIIKSYKLVDLETLFSQIQYDLNNITDDTITPEVEQLAISSNGATTDISNIATTDSAGANHLDNLPFIPIPGTNNE